MFARLMGLKTLSPKDVHRLLESGTAVVIDVNAPGSWERARVPGARNLDPSSYGEADLPKDRGATIVFYCSNVMCRKAPNAARRARSMGYTNIYVMSAGIKGWLEAGLPMETAR